MKELITEAPKEKKSTFKSFLELIGMFSLATVLAALLVGGMFFGIRALTFASKNHSYERAELSQMDYSLTKDGTNIKFYLDGEEHQIAFCEKIDSWSGKTECFNSDHTVKLQHSTTRGNSFHKPSLNIVGSEVTYNLVCNIDKDGKYCVPVEFTMGKYADE